MSDEQKSEAEKFDAVIEHGGQAYVHIDLVAPLLSFLASIEVDSAAAGAIAEDCTEVLNQVGSVIPELVDASRKEVAEFTAKQADGMQKHLDELEQEGDIESAGVDERGDKKYRITEKGTARVEQIIARSGLSREDFMEALGVRN